MEIKVLPVKTLAKLGFKIEPIHAEAAEVWLPSLVDTINAHHNLQLGCTAGDVVVIPKPPLRLNYADVKSLYDPPVIESGRIDALSSVEHTGYFGIVVPPVQPAQELNVTAKKYSDMTALCESLTKEFVNDSYQVRIPTLPEMLYALRVLIESEDVIPMTLRNIFFRTSTSYQCSISGMRHPEQMVAVMSGVECQPTKTYCVELVRETFKIDAWPIKNNIGMTTLLLIDRVDECLKKKK